MNRSIKILVSSIFLLSTIVGLFVYCTHFQKNRAIFVPPTGQALTPPMGWNGWNHFGCRPELDEQAFKDMVDSLVASGMKDAGYTYMNLDDCWQIARAADGTIVADAARFPSGIKALADYVHSKGLKFGIYTSGGRITCEGRPGSYNYEKQDVQTYADWGVDYIKVDWCGIEYLDTKTQYEIWKQEIAATHRPMLLSVTIAAIDKIDNNKVWLWARETGQTWRTARDIQDYWPDMLRVLDKNSRYAAYNGPGGWNDADMLQVGNGHMTVEEYRTHFTMWAMMASPLLASNDLRSMPEDIKNILTQPEVIRINQDPLGSQAKLLREDNGLQVWVKDLEKKGEKAVALVNRRDDPAEMSVGWSELGFAPLVRVRDVWQKTPATTFTEEYRATVPAHGVKLLTVSGLNLEVLNTLKGYFSPERSYDLVNLATDTRTKTDDKDRIEIDTRNKEIKMSPFSDVAYMLNKKCATFSTTFKVDQEKSEPQTQLLFKIYGDGRLLYESDTMGRDEPATTTTVDVHQVSVLNLFVAPLDPRSFYPQIGKWSNATIRCKQID